MTSVTHQIPERQELRAYEAALPAMLEHHAGEFVVIHGFSVEAYFSTYAAALEWAYEKFGLEPFFVKRVAAGANIVHFTRDLGPCRK
jgi:hypothetical protein